VDDFDRLKIPLPRQRATFVQFVRALRAEHALCKSNPGAPSSLHYVEPTGPTITVHCAGCRGTWTRTINADDLIEVMRLNRSGTERQP